MSSTKSMLEKIEKDLFMCNQDVKQCVYTSRDTVHSISSTLCCNIIQLEDHIQLVESLLDTETLSHTNSQPAFPVIPITEQQ